MNVQSSQTPGVIAVQPHVPGQQRTNGLATASFVLGLVAIFAMFIVPLVGLVTALVGVGLGVPGLVMARERQTGKALAMCGLALSTLAILVLIVLSLATFGPGQSSADTGPASIGNTAP